MSCYNVNDDEVLWARAHVRWTKREIKVSLVGWTFLEKTPNCSTDTDDTSDEGT